MRTWFITGGTPGGFGMSYAEAELEIGDRVVLTARQTAPAPRRSAARSAVPVEISLPAWRRPSWAKTRSAT